MKKSLGAKTLLPLTPVVLVGTYNDEQKPNLMAAAWCGVVCSKPPCLSVSLRKATYTHRWIVKNQAFTMVPALTEFAEKADYMGMSSGRDTSKFEVAGITPVEGQEVRAPYVDEWPMAIELKLVETVELGLHTMFVGQVMDVKVDEAYLNEKGLPDIVKLNPMLYSPESRNYYNSASQLGGAYDMGRKVSGL
jgi:flavin reductase (DIM6/NTAB) family NADH-FMN oxidoreductase RutF